MRQFTRTLELELGERKADGRRTFNAVLSTSTPVKRRSYDGEFLEVLSHARDAIDLSRGPLPLIESHNRESLPLGRVDNIRIDGDKLRGTVTFGASARAREVEADVESGIIRGLSVGYRIEQTTESVTGKVKTITATRWAPFETSVVAVPADANAGFNRSGAMENENPEQAGTPDPIATERDRQRNIRELGRAYHAPEARVAELLDNGTAVDAARTALRTAWTSHNEPHRSGHIEPGNGQRDTRELELMVEALTSRCGGPAPSAEAREYMRMSTVDFARHRLERRGVSTRMMSKNQIIERSLHTTSDFPELLTSTGNRLLRTAYTSYQGGLQRACKQATAPDFRPVNKLQLGESAALAQVNEGGEFTRGTMAESKEAYSLATFGKIFGISRQALVNDDLGAFADMSTRLGRAASEFVAARLVALLVSNPTLADDAKAVFHADHANFTTGPGTVISVANLGIAMKLMRLQKGLDGVTPIDVTPKYLIVPAALETVALQTITAITPAQSSNVNPFAGKLEPIVDPRLDASSATAWYLAADAAAIDTIEYAYLDGANGPEVILREGFDVDGMEWKVRLDFGAAILDFRGLYKNAGA